MSVLHCISSLICFKKNCLIHSLHNERVIKLPCMSSGSKGKVVIKRPRPRQTGPLVQRPTLHITPPHHLKILPLPHYTNGAANFYWNGNGRVLVHNSVDLNSTPHFHFFLPFFQSAIEREIRTLFFIPHSTHLNSFGSEVIKERSCFALLWFYMKCSAYNCDMHRIHKIRHIPSIFLNDSFWFRSVSTSPSPFNFHIFNFTVAILRII